MIKKAILLISLFVPLMHSTASIIVLNGISSSGKTSNALELQKIVDGEWVIVGNDNALFSFVMNECERVGFINKTLPVAQKQRLLQNFMQLPEEQQKNLIGKIDKNVIKEWMHNAIKALIADNKNIIVDIVQCKDLEKGTLAFLKNQKNIHLFSVLNYCSVADIAQHVFKRNDLTDLAEHRDMGMVIKQFCKFFMPTNFADEAVDTLTKQDCNSLIDSVFVATQAVELKELFSTIFFANNENIVGIAPHVSHDFVVDTGKHSTLECAQLIKEGFEKHAKLKAENALQFEIVPFDYSDEKMKEQMCIMVRDDQEIQHAIHETEEGQREFLSKGCQAGSSVMVCRSLQNPATIYGFMNYDQANAIYCSSHPESGLWFSRKPQEDHNYSLVKIFELTACLNSFAVHKDYRGKGVAQAMLNYFEQDCKNKGMQRLMLFVNIDNEKAIKLYNKFGFAIDLAYNDNVISHTMFKLISA